MKPEDPHPPEETAPPEDVETPAADADTEDAPAVEAEAVTEETAEEAPADTPEEPESEIGNLKRIIEAVLFASQKPVSSKELIAVCKGAAEAEKEKPDSPARAFAKIKAPKIQAAIEELELDCADPRCTHEVRETAAGWQLVTKPEFSPWLRQLYPENRPARLSAPAMETLAIIAYRQPITRADIEAVRGVAVDGVMQTLLDRSLVKIAGRADVPGRPLLYETTQYFMEHFGLKDLEELPNASELRTISLPTADPPEETTAEPPTDSQETSAQTATPGETPEASEADETPEESDAPEVGEPAAPPEAETDDTPPPKPEETS